MFSIGGGLLLVGCGKMGGALLTGWLEQGLAPEKVTVLDPMGLPEGLAGSGIRHVTDSAEISGQSLFEVVVLAVKPQQMEAILPAFSTLPGGDCVYLSIAAGKTLDFFAGHLGAQAAVVRAMPNTPAAIGRGISVLCASESVSAAQRDLAAKLMAAAGGVEWIADEGFMDAVTAVSGSGPAYVFLLMECLARAGVEAGLPAELAARLAQETVSGAGELARRASEDPAVLRQNVTSPGGTTAAALEVLMADDGLQPLLTRAVAAAAKRGRELAG
jgi:pyrroline-5-carboxylate reductase